LATQNHAPGAAEITRRNVETMRRLEELASQNRTIGDRVASFVARFCGSPTFVWVHAVVFGSWIGWNVWPGLKHPDPYPFTFLTMWASMEAIFLSSFILIAQNYAMRISERRDKLDVQINLLTEQEITKVLQMLQDISAAVGAGQKPDPEVQALAEVTEHQALVEQIDQAAQEPVRKS
jgi:uncharacterized membrane protein